ncbi:LPS-assembly protein LptD [Aminobacter sp. MDW-2]|uniref:LPS-assembly protein LptD n=1 Tax=Aminobacter sp. MDW-2 TaxID=2666139 RepID=UPI0012AF10CB|nr:LPS-assembly protein LptD [Aminobacter sp. MDW-2]MRX33509.1 LPS assembly protein LptD [Aminobacter sp. MDW-2]QNH33439.1 LPS-assembly protein LptD [Aminobacter sp. MDW-2]
MANRRAHMAGLLGATALACLFAVALPSAPAFAQTVADLAPSVPEGAQMLLEADTLVYDNDASTVTAVGGVQIDYAGNRLVAQRVTYDRKTSRLIASGNVEVVNSDGTKIFSQEIDITDDFADGFVNTLRIETVDKTYFAAESAKREGGFLTTFNNGVYTACEPCEAKPDKAPIWRVKAQKIIWNGKKKTVRFENSNFEFFGFPIAFLPAFEIADPTVKRKSGFLMPGVSFNSKLGIGVSVPYYFALSPTYDLTVKGTGYTKQGFLGEAEWRQRFNNGEYSLKMAGIYQMNPDKFDVNTVDRGPTGDENKLRGMVGTKGHFDLNPRWAFGWNILAQTDKNFSRTYGINGFSESTHRSEVYLTGLNDRNYFDLRAMRFQVQEEALDSDPNARADKQPWVLPSLDYAYIPDAPLAGGELSFNVNSRVIQRSDLDANLTAPNGPTVHGIEGTSSRITAEAQWKRTIVTDGGLLVTPLLAFRADGSYVDASAASLAAINTMAADPRINVAEDVRSSLFRYMATLGLELRWPVLFSSTSSTHVLEPMAQIFARPSESAIGGLGIPNEDAQSFVFDAASLFERDKFSGYDRMEGGTRANLGLRYSGSFNNGWTTNALVGQSYHLAGDNSFAAPDLVNAGAYSGLETDTSDYVALAGIASPNGFSASVSGRFDERTFDVRRAEMKVGLDARPLAVSARYAFIQAQPLYGFANDRHEVTLGATARFNDQWRVFGSGTYDIQGDLLVKNGVGFAYDDECFTYLMSYSESRDHNKPDDVSRTVGFNISFRTIGDFGNATSAF